MQSNKPTNFQDWVTLTLPSSFRTLIRYNYVVHVPLQQKRNLSEKLLSVLLRKSEQTKRFNFVPKSQSGAVRSRVMWLRGWLVYYKIFMAIFVHCFSINLYSWRVYIVKHSVHQLDNSCIRRHGLTSLLHTSARKSTAAATFQQSFV